MVHSLRIDCPGQGLHEFTDALDAVVRAAAAGGFGDEVGDGSRDASASGSLSGSFSGSFSGSLSGSLSGLCSVFVQHTSASLIIQENADPSARRDLEAWLDRLVPERDPLYTHTLEGDDDMPAHIKAAITATSLSIPIIDGRLGLGTWQGVYLWEHRRAPGTRNVLVHIGL